MARKPDAPSFNDVLTRLGSEHFDVAPAGKGSAPVSGANRVSKYGCAAEIAPASVAGSNVRVVTRGGWLLGGEIASLLDRGYQKFLKTSRLEIPATADILKAVHRFNEEFTEACGGQELYNESMGTTSDLYVYDRVKGRA